MKLFLLLLLLPFIGFSQQDSIWSKAEMSPPAITSVNAVSFNSYVSVIAHFTTVKALQNDNNEFSVETWTHAEDTFNRKLNILKSDGSFTSINQTGQNLATTLMPMYRNVFKHGNDYVHIVEFEEAGISDSVYVYDQDSGLKKSFAISSHDIQNVFLENDQLIVVYNSQTEILSAIKIYDLNGNLLKETIIGYKIKKAFYQDNQIIVCPLLENKGIKIYDMDLKFLVGFSVSGYPDFLLGKGFMIAKSPGETSTMFYNLDNHQIHNFGSGIDQVFTDPDSEIFYLRRGNIVMAYSSDLKEGLSFELPALALSDKSYNDVEYKNGYFLVTQKYNDGFYNRTFYVQNKSGEILYTEKVKYGGSTEPLNFAIIETDPADNVLFFSANGLTKIKKSGEVMWHREKPYEKGFYMRPQLFMNGDGSFMILANYNLWNTIAILFENDESRCNYSVGNPIPAQACAPLGQATHQYIGSFNGNLSGAQIITDLDAQRYVDMPYQSLGLSFNWYKDGQLDSTNYLYNPEPDHRYQLEIAQPGCNNKSEEVHFAYGSNDELLSPSLTAKENKVAIGNSTLLLGTCDNALVTFQQRPDNLPGNLNRDELMVTPESTTTYTMTCERKLQPLSYNSQTGYSPSGPVLECTTALKEVQVIVFDPNAVLSNPLETTEIKLFPNPTSHYFQVLNPIGDRLQELEILDFNGRIVQHFREDNMPADQKFDLQFVSQQSGSYLIKMTFGKGVITKRLALK